MKHTYTCLYHIDIFKNHIDIGVIFTNVAIQTASIRRFLKPLVHWYRHVFSSTGHVKKGSIEST